MTDNDIIHEAAHHISFNSRTGEFTEIPSTRNIVDLVRNILKTTAAADTKRIDFLEAQAGITIHEPVAMAGTVSESKSCLLTDTFGDVIAEGTTLREAIDVADKKRARS